MVIAPIGFVCDHVEVLYDIDIGFREFAESRSSSCGGRVAEYFAYVHCGAGQAGVNAAGAGLGDCLAGMKRIAIIGGGIAGLSAAFYLEKARRAGADLQWVLFEKSDRLGGVIQTERRDGFVIEAGPDSFLSIKPDASRLCQELGIGDQLIPSNDASRKTYILVKGKLVPIPQGLEFMVPTRIWPMATTPLFSFSTKLRMAAELFSAGAQRRGR